MDLAVATFSGFGLALLAPALHRRLGERVSLLLALLPLSLTIYFGWQVALPTGVPATARYEWVPSLDLRWSLYLDGLSLLMVSAIAGMGTFVLLYSKGYMEGQQKLGLFYAYLLSFMAAMLGLVLAGNVLTLYVFWELTTLTSFLLIGFEHDRASARRAAVQGLLTTALGGLAMLAGLVLLGIAAGSFEFAELLQRGTQVRAHPWYPVILVLILIGAFTKSAQFPFHYWLPNAMEAPTPVSAYLHSATMVKAGVYLLARLLPVLGGTYEWTLIVTAVGAGTMFLGAAMAYFHHEMKAVLAYLTINVLGTLVMLLGIGTTMAVKAMLAYLVAHTLYKGALFMIAGAVGHQFHTMDTRRLSGLRQHMPLTCAAAVLAALSMAGVAPLLGFVAKELYLEAVLEGALAPRLLTALSVSASALVAAGAAIVAIGPFWGHSREAATEVHHARSWLVITPLLLAAAGLAAGIFAPTIVAPLIEPALGSIVREPADVELALWHGATVPLILSIIALAVGVMLFALREVILRPMRGVRFFSRWGPESWYRLSLSFLQRIAEGQTAILQNGYLRRYVLIVLAAKVATISAVLYYLELGVEVPPSIGIRFHEGVAAVVILAAAWTSVQSTSRYRAIASLGVIGMNIAWIYALFGGPDLAMTQIVVEALTVLLFVVAFRGLPDFRTVSSTTTRARDALIALAAGALVASLLILATSSYSPSSVSGYYADNSYTQAHGRNVVNVILVDFRALDTLGEATVLATAAMGVYVLMRLVLERRSRV